MPNNVEAFIRGWRDKVTGYYIKVVVTRRRKGMQADSIAFTQTSLARFIWYIEKVKFMGNSSFLEYSLCPLSAGWRICGKIEYNGKSCP